MTIERCVELQDKLLCLENALRHYGMNAESKATFCILEGLICHRDKDDTKQAEQRCLEFWLNISTFGIGSTVNMF